MFVAEAAGGRTARRRARQAKRSQEVHASAAEIGRVPAVRNPLRKWLATESLLFFLRSYFPRSTGLHPFSADHIAFIARVEAAIVEGGREVDAVYRGFGKTTVAELACLWAVLTGRVRFAVIAGADGKAAAANLASLKQEVSGNDLLLEDWPEVCFPVRAMEGKVQRCPSQTCGGERTQMRWTGDEIVFPTVAGSKAAGGCIRCKGLLAVNRGSTHKWMGHQYRPEFVFIDDPQTNLTAASPAMIAKQLDAIYKVILKLGSHGGRLGVFVAGTVIQPDDLMARLLDAEEHPSWTGQRVPMVREWSSVHEEEWLGEYRRLRSDFDRSDALDREAARRRATAYFEARREAMEAGASVSWKWCYSAAVGEVSAVQHCYNLLIDDGEEVFAAECQQQPQRGQDVENVTGAELRKRLHREKRGVVPEGVQVVTAFVDVQSRALYWMVVGWGEGFRGWVLDYGCWPEQGLRYFRYGDVRRTLRRRYRGRGEEGAIMAGLGELLGNLLDRDYGGGVRVSSVGVDAGYLQDVVVGACRSVGSPAVWASKGFGVGVADRPMSDRRVEIGCRRGREWVEVRLKGRRGRMVHFDANYWKSVVRGGLAVPVEGVGAITLFTGADHACVVDHLTAEVGTRAVSEERSVVLWKMIPGRDNHWLDGLVGCAVGASRAGILRPGQAAAAPRRRQRKKVSYL